MFFFFLLYLLFWWCWGLNPGSHTCWASVISWGRYTPSLFFFLFPDRVSLSSLGQHWILVLWPWPLECLCHQIWIVFLLFFKWTCNRAWWYVPISPGIWKMEVEGPEVKGPLWQAAKFETSLSFVRPNLRKPKIKNRMSFIMIVHMQ